MHIKLLVVDIVIYIIMHTHVTLTSITNCPAYVP